MPPLTRAALLGELSDLVDTALAGQGRLLVVSGEAGIGKTTLVRHLAQEAQAARTPVLWGACEPLTTTRPLLPLHDWGRTTGGELAAAMAGEDRGRDLFALALSLLQTPTLAIIEDVHWADQATLDLLVYLGRRVVDLPSALVLTTRDVPPRLAGLGRRVAVPPLSEAEVATLTAGSGLDAGRVHAVTGGNAFFVSQLVGAPTAGVPESVREAVLARLLALSEPARAVVETVAVAPHCAQLQILYDAAAASPADVEEAERAGLLECDGRVVTFRHELAREAVEEATPGPRRHERHAAVLTGLLARNTGSDAALAYHAHFSDEHELALKHGLAAGRESVRAGARREACVQLERAAVHLEHATPRQAIELLRTHATALGDVRDDAAATAVSERAVAMARELGDPDILAGELGQHAFAFWRLGDMARARRLVDEAVAVGSEAPESEGNLMALTRAATLHMLAREIDAALSTGRAAADLARRLGDRHGLADALHVLGTSTWNRAPEEAEALMMEALALAESVGDDCLAALIMLNLGSAAGEVRCYRPAREWLARCRVFSAERDLDNWVSYAVCWLARLALEEGDLTGAGELAELCLEAPNLIGAIGAHTVLGRARHRLGEPGARDELDRAWALAEPTEELQRTWPVAAGYAEMGHTDHLLAVFEQAVDLEQEWSVGELGWHLVRLGLLEPGDPRLRGAAAPYDAMIRGDWATASRRWSELGCRYDAALADGETGEPEAMRRAIGALDAMGARCDADKIAARLRAVDGSAVRRARRSTAAHPFGLTDREVEVAGLLRGGLSNAEIAARTFTSVKTVGHHVSAILAKVGAPSRREAVARIWGSAPDAAPRLAQRVSPL